jgi:RND family efflux transporter MFP subunit
MKLKAKVILIPLLIIVIGIVVMQVLAGFKKDPPQKAPAPRPKIVEATVTELSDVPAEIIAYGRLMSAQPVILYSEVSGTLMEGDVPFQPGQSFKRGDLLIKVDDRQMKLDLNSAKSDFLNALATVLPEIKVDFPDRYEIWQNYFNSCGFDKELASLPEVEDQKIKLYLTRFNVYKLYFTAQNLEIRLDKHYFHAPFEGSIVMTDLRSGSTVRSGSKLGEIINLENLEVEVPVATQDIQWINRQKPVTFSSLEIPGQWKGYIKRIGKSIDTQTQTVPVYISIDKTGSNHIYNGAFLEAHIAGTMIKNAVAVPQKAIYNERFVYLIKNGKFDYREVKIARKETDSVIVTGGIDTGDTLVVEVLQGVAPGMLATAKISGSGERSPQ